MAQGISRAAMPLLLAAFALQGCAAAAVGAGALAVGAAVQERSIGDAIDDTAIQVGLNSRLGARPDLFSTVYLEVVEGRVLLTGAVPTPPQRIDAERIAWSVPGVHAVINEIEVTHPPTLGSYLSDVAIRNQLRALMLADPGIRSINYNIEVVNGNVYLLGLAQSKAELDKTVYLSRTVYGVRKVVSHVLLRGDPRRHSPGFRI